MTTDYYNDYFFTTNQTGYECPNIPYECNPTSACARDSTTGLRYCCSDDNKWCWTASRTCQTDGTTVDCGSGDNTWCCLDKTEICTTGKDQINICFNKTPTLLLNITTEVLNDTLKSLSSAAPSANSYTFTPQALMAQTQTGSSSTTAAPSSTSPGSSSSPTTSSESHASSSHLSGGAIAGIVIGCLAVLALVIAAAFYCLRKRKQPAVAAPPVAELSEAAPKQGSYYAPRYAVSPSELQGENPTSELSTQDNRPHELPGHP